jgi:hypothetical protein
MIAKTATIKATIRTSQRKLLTAAPPATARMIKAMTRIQSSDIEGSFRRGQDVATTWPMPPLNDRGRVWDTPSR